MKERNVSVPPCQIIGIDFIFRNVTENVCSYRQYLTDLVYFLEGEKVSLARQKHANYTENC